MCESNPDGEIAECYTQQRLRIVGFHNFRVTGGVPRLLDSPSESGLENDSISRAKRSRRRSEPDAGIELWLYDP